MTGRQEPTSVESVYVHAPFCARRCIYCDFAVTVQRQGDLPAWSEALRRELAEVAAGGEVLLAERLSTVYVGGGTPSLLGPAAMASLAAVLGPQRLGSEGLEWTAEANPESLSAEVADAWARAGVNRLSLGVQSFDTQALQWMGRLHGPEGVIGAVERSRSAGLENISVDLIFALPDEVTRSWDDDLDRALSLGVPHVSLYGLTVESETALGRAVASGRSSGVNDGRYRDEYLRAAEVLGSAGYEHYEVSNFALPGRRSRHNSVYWSGAPYLGLGNGAHSYRHPVRRWNVRDWETYRSRLETGQSAEDDRETLDEEAAGLERVWLQLRTQDGVEEPPSGSGASALVDGWSRRGWATNTGSRVRLTAEGWLLLDRLAVELTDALRGLT